MSVDGFVSECVEGFTFTQSEMLLTALAKFHSKFLCNSHAQLRQQLQSQVQLPLQQLSLWKFGGYWTGRKRLLPALQQKWKQVMHMYSHSLTYVPCPL